MSYCIIPCIAFFKLNWHFPIKQINSIYNKISIIVWRHLTIDSISLHFVHTDGDVLFSVIKSAVLQEKVVNSQYAYNIYKNNKTFLQPCWDLTWKVSQLDLAWCAILFVKSGYHGIRKHGHTRFACKVSCEGQKSCFKYLCESGHYVAAFHCNMLQWNAAT